MIWLYLGMALSITWGIIITIWAFIYVAVVLSTAVDDEVVPTTKEWAISASLVTLSIVIWWIVWALSLYI
jgi:hypothetical protein